MEFLRNKFGIIFPYVLEWRLTDACNLRCKYCSEYKPEYVDINYDEILTKVIKLAPKHIWLGGGEPALVKQLLEIVKKLKEVLNPHIGINTNLTKIEVIAEILPYINDLIISIDTMDKEISKKYRGINPGKIISDIKKLSKLKKNSNYNVNITVISVVFKDSLQNNGIENLNDALYKISPNMYQMFCPVYPEHKTESIINDTEAKEDFFQIVEKLKVKNRKIIVNYPEFSGGKKYHPIKCYRRFFRIQLVTNREFFSPCPPANPFNPVCNTPCNCAAFIDDILYAKNKETVRGSQLRGRLNKAEVEYLHAFVKKHINPEIPENIYEDLLIA